ncbi:MAG: hypothetical protein GAK30_02996 [Paracidovorax wautersii]|uniref:Type IV pilus assembly protein PilW n=1 Tax=Paracidovorax wautersii TaxID=1177982 RepID=A0A7V8JPI2_9BURK|nr:MAG: hypothetical protein GAK30_02996 [Paracidovorax wautersii]
MNTRPPALRDQRGMTLPELLVALLLTLAVVLGGSAALSAARASHATLDAAAQLRDSARLVGALLQPLVAQAGYRDLHAATLRGSALQPASHDALAWLAGADAVSVVGRTPPAYSASHVNHSDVLVLRTMASARDDVPYGWSPGAAAPVSDRAMADCKCTVRATASRGPHEWIDNYLYVSRESTDAEPALYCGSQGASGSSFTVQPLVRGVESFQVLYGVADHDGRVRHVTAGALASPADWQRVRSLRIGLVLRSPKAAWVDTRAAAVLYPLGAAYASSADAGSTFTPPADGRLRQVVTLTLALRNAP